jgi:hypothetical protein
LEINIAGYSVAIFQALITFGENSDFGIRKSEVEIENEDKPIF